MRQLILHRERALAGFALLHYAVLDRDKTEFLRQQDQKPYTCRPEWGGDFALRNGETRRVELDEGEHTLFVAVYLESRRIITETMTIPAGNEDAKFTIFTEFDGYHSVDIVLRKTDEGDST
jgi:hypothetical protein